MTIAEKIDALRKQAEYLEAVEKVREECVNNRDWMCSNDDDGNPIPPSEDEWNYDKYKVWCEIVEFLDKKAK